MFGSSRLVILFSRSVLMVVLSLSLFFGGIVLLLTKVPGWSLFFGLIIIPIGFVLTILTFDEVARSLIARQYKTPAIARKIAKTIPKRRLICPGVKPFFSHRLYPTIFKDYKLSWFNRHDKKITSFSFLLLN